MTATEKLAEFALAAFSREMPKNVSNVAILAIIDQYGLQIGGSEFPWSRSIYQYIKSFAGIGSSTITRYGDPVSAVQAAFINGSFAHAQDFDDSHQEAQTHPGSVVIPAAIAIGEHLDLSGEIILKAIIIGIEIMLRLAHSLCPSCIEGGHHTPPTIGPFGAAIACGLLLGLNKNQLVNALGICGSYSGGLVEYTLSGGSVKRIHTGIGARAGLEAALLAQRGLTGPVTIIDGKKGMWEIFGRGKAFPERLFNQIGEHYMLTTLMFKPYNCCYLIHPAIEAFLKLCKENNLSENDIEHVSVGYSDFSISHAGKIIIPTDELGAQFSTSFTLALSFLKEAPGMWSYTQENLHNQNITELAEKIHVVQDKQANDAFPKKNGCIVTIQTKNGQTLSCRITDPKGSPENLLTESDVREKYFKNTCPVIGKEQASVLYEKLSQFGLLESVRELGCHFRYQKPLMARL